MPNTRVNDIILLYKLECFIGISTAEKNRITTREKITKIFHRCLR